MNPYWTLPLIRASVLGVAAAFLGLGWRGFVFATLVTVAFIITDEIAEKVTQR